MRAYLRDPVLIIAWAAIVYMAGLQGVIRAPVFFNGDAGPKLLMTRQIAEGRSSACLQLPGAPWAQDLWRQGWFPFKKPFVYEMNGAMVPAFPVAFSVMSAPLYRLFGYRGLYALPLAAGVALVLCLYLFSRGLNLNPLERAVVLSSFAFATYAPLYSAMFWEHLPSVALSTMGCFAVLKVTRPASPARAFSGGALMGMAGWLRPEAIVFFGAVAGVWGVWCFSRRQLAGWVFFAAGGSLFLSLLFSGNGLAYGTLLGPHAIDVVGSRTLAARLAELPGIARDLFSGLAAFAPLCCFALACAAGMLFPAARCCSAGPALVPLALICLAFFAGVLSIVPNSGGLQWGPRYLMHCLPLGAVAAGLVLSAARELGSGAARRALLACMCALLAWGTWHNAVGGPRMLRENYQSRIEPAMDFLMGHDPAPVVSFDQYVPQEMAWLLYRQPFFTLPGSSQPSRDLLAISEKLFMAATTQSDLNAPDYKGSPPALQPIRIPGPPVRIDMQPAGRFGAAYTVYEVAVSL